MDELSDAPCPDCRAINSHNGEKKWGRIGIPYNRVDQYPDFPTLEGFARNGCAFCRLLRHALQDKYSDEKIAEAESEFHPSIRAKWSLSGWNGHVTVRRAFFLTERDWAERDASQIPEQSLGSVRTLGLEVWPYPPRRSDCNPELNRSWVWFSVYADADSEASPYGGSRRRKPDTETLSEANVLLISTWLKNCSRLHTECRQKSGTQLPTRVIDVGPGDGSQEPRLLATSKGSGDYVTLSHCWGSLMESGAGKHARTLKTNLKDMLRGIPLNSLPQTFQDAISTVRKLQLRFLWIDALCIIQDDPVDWAREAASMNSVYGSAYLTIAATSALSSTDGFLKRSQERAVSVPYHRDIGDEPAGRLFLAYMRTGGDQGSWFSNIETTRWNTRGWTFQERLLSKRVLHFTERKMFWECRVTDASEENEPPRDARYRTSWLKVEGPSAPGLLPEKNARASESRFDVWYSLVSEYSARELSCETDVLPALSGLAQAFRAIYSMEKATNDDDYFAGIWRDDLSRGLLWNPHDNSRESRYSQYIAPTWSWASIKGQVHFPSGSLDTPCTPSFVKANLERNPEDHLGAIVAARLTLIAKVRRLCQVAAKVHSSRLQLDLRFESNTIGSGAFDVQNEGGKKDVWVMECMLQKPWDFRDHPTVLLLCKSGNTPDTYERVGYGRLEEDFLGFFADCEAREVTLI